jgi:hypothetical protein
MDIAQLIGINTIVLVVIVMLVLVFLFGISRELRKTAEAVGRVECNEPYYSMETMQCLEQVRADFLRRAITPMSIGNVYQVS